MPRPARRRATPTWSSPASAAGRTPPGTFAGFVDTAARLVGVEAAGGAAIGRGIPGVLHGMRSQLLQDEDGQILEAHSISAGLDYPGIGPEHAYLADDRPGRLRAGRPTTRCSTRFSCSPGPRGSSRPSSRPTRSPGSCARRGGEVPAGSTVLVTLSGRGDKDVAQVMRRCLA